MLVVTKLDRLARSVPDARNIIEELTAREVQLNIAGSVHDPNDLVGRLLLNLESAAASVGADTACNSLLALTAIPVGLSNALGDAGCTTLSAGASNAVKG